MNALQLHTIPSSSVPLIQSFEDLPVDNYLKESYFFRMRRYSSCVKRGNDYLWETTSETFYQTKAINSYSGDIKRTFAPLGRVTREYITSVLLPECIRYLPQNPVSIGAHQIPAEVFEDTNAIRISFGRPENILNEGLSRLDKAFNTIKGY